MTRIFFALLMVSVAFTACKQGKAPEVAEDGTAYYGEKITADGAISYEELLKQMDGKEEVANVKVKGKVESVCQAKGCWMNIVPTSGTGEEMFVKFKDYGFFMPFDLAGSEVIMRGRAFVEETSVEELQHYAEDEGKSQEEIAKITEPITELKFMADGVIVL